MNIALFPSAFHPHVGGVEELSRQLAHSLTARGHKAIVLTNRWPRNLPEFEDYEGLSIYRLAFRVPEGCPKSRVSYALTHRAIVRQMQHILRQHEIDMIHVQCISSNGFYAHIAARDLSLPLVVTAQGELTMDAGHLYQRKSFMNGFLPRLLQDADFVTGCSKRTLDDVLAHVGQSIAAKARPVFNGASTRDFDVGSPYQHPRPYILGIGRAVPQKAFDILIRAFASSGLTTHDVIIAGDGPELPAWKSLAHVLKVSDRVLFFGNAHRTQAISLFLGSSFVALPSRSDEGLPVVSVESMAAGKAIVATSVGGVPEAVLQDVTGLIVPREDVSAFAEGLRMLASDEPLRRKMGAAGRERAQEFSWDTITDQYLEVYREAMDSFRCLT